MTERMRGLAVETVNGTDCLVLKGDGGGRIAIPISGLQVFVETIDQRVQAFRNSEGDNGKVWQQKIVRPVTTAQVAEHLTTESQRVFLHLDRGLPTELTLSLSRSCAREIGAALVEEATKSGEDRHHH